MPRKIMVGDKEQVFSATVIAENNQVITMDVELNQSGYGVQTQTIKVEAIFTLGEGSEATGTFSSTDGGVRFTFVNWTNSLGVSTPTPMKFGNLGPMKMYLSAANHYMGGGNLCTFTILLGE